MKVLLDSSTLIAAMLPDHVHHQSAHQWHSQAKSRSFEFLVSGHTLAELYSVLTRLPRRPPITASEALQMIVDNVTLCGSVIVLTAQDYGSLIEDLSQRGIIGGAVYDAVIAKAAEIGRADLLVTLNPAHFQQVRPAGANRIVTPSTSVSFSP